MFVSSKHMFALLMLATVLHSSEATYNVSSYCTMVSPKTKLPNTKSCQDYYLCGLDGAYTEESCDRTYFFDKNLQTCAPSDTVNCYYGLENPCINTQVSPSYVPREGCGAFYYCINQKVVGEGNCDKNQVFKDGECMWGTCTTDPQQSGKDAVNICTIMPENVYFGTTYNCAQYQQCPSGKAEPEVGSCKADMAFDLKLGLCNYEDVTDCSRVTGEQTPGGSGDEPCSTPNTLKANENKCSGYFKCDGQKWVSQSCGIMYWDVLTQTCMQRQRATPAEDCDRCEGCKGKFANAVNATCTEYYICSMNKKVSSHSCTNGYFDEAAQACIHGGNLTAYAAVNGACYKAPVSCKCDAPDSKTGKCASTDNCKCGLNGVNHKECIVCSDTIDPATGICQNGACSCEKRAADKCSVADDCSCGLDATDKTKCMTCDPKDLDDKGVCGTAPVTADCECAKREVDKCSAQDSCNCGLDASDKTKCITCDAKDLDDKGVCGTAPVTTDCECAKREVDKCSAQDSCNCGLDASDKTKCITCDAKDLDDKGVCGTAPVTADCECAKREVDKCSAQDSCNCGLDASDKTKCITCDAKDLDDKGICGTAPAASDCECANREVGKCSAQDGCNCGLDASDKSKCITCDAKDLDDKGICGTAPAASDCECAKREVDKCSAQDGCNCGLDASDKSKCKTCDAKDLDDKGICGTAPDTADCDCTKREVDKCSAQDSCNCGLDATDKKKCIICDPKEACDSA